MKEIPLSQESLQALPYAVLTELSKATGKANPIAANVQGTVILDDHDNFIEYKPYQRCCTLFVRSKKLSFGCPTIEVLENEDDKKNGVHRLLCTVPGILLPEQLGVLNFAKENSKTVQVELTLIEDGKFTDGTWGFYRVARITQSEKSAKILLESLFVSVSWIQDFAQMTRITYPGALANLAKTLKVPPNKVEAVVTQSRVSFSDALNLKDIISLALCRAAMEYKGTLDFKISHSQNPLMSETKIEIFPTGKPLEKIPYLEVITTVGSDNCLDDIVIKNEIVTSFVDQNYYSAAEQHKFISAMIALTSKPQMDQAFRILSEFPSIN